MNTDAVKLLLVRFVLFLHDFYLDRCRDFWRIKIILVRAYCTYACSQLNPIKKAQRVLFAELVDMDGDVALYRCDITPTIQAFYKHDVTLSVASMDRWISKVEIQDVNGNSQINFINKLRMIYIDRGEIKTSLIHLEDDCELFTDSECCDVELHKLPYRVITMDAIKV